MAERPKTEESSAEGGESPEKSVNKAIDAIEAKDGANPIWLDAGKSFFKAAGITTGVGILAFLALSLVVIAGSVYAYASAMEKILGIPKVEMPKIFKGGSKPKKST